MKRLIVSGGLVTVVYALALIIGTAIAAPVVFSPQMYTELYGGITGDWQQYGEMFTMLQSQWFWKAFLGVITVVPAIFALHFLVIGAKEFSHDGPGVFIFSVFTRIIHWIAAASFTLLVITGLLIIFGGFLGGGAPIRFARYVHIVCALIFAIAAIPMFLIWVKDMLPAPVDIKWIFILGGYLSKKKKPIPAGKFNAGQKAWFWLSTAGGGVMAYTGFYIWSLQGNLDMIQLYVIIHNVLGMVVVALFLTHCYMSLFAIKGSLHSMITGYKPKEEVDILHSRYKYKLEE